jgi:hypothetical protein
VRSSPKKGCYIPKCREFLCHRVRHLHGRYAESLRYRTLYSDWSHGLSNRKVHRSTINNFRPIHQGSRYRPKGRFDGASKKTHAVVFAIVQLAGCQHQVEHEEDWCIVPVINLEDSLIQSHRRMRMSTSAKRSSSDDGGLRKNPLRLECDRGKYDEFETHGSLRFEHGQIDRYTMRPFTVNP